MELMLNCDVCGVGATIEGVESPAVAQGFLDNWSEAHKHTIEERQQYVDAEIAVREYQHSHPFDGDTEED